MEVPKLSFVEPAKPEFLHHFDKTKSPVVRNILCRGIRIGVIWRMSACNYVAWWSLTDKPIPVRHMNFASTDNKSLRSAMNSVTRLFNQSLTNAMKMLSPLTDK
jgi:hypothetical protein